jgi:hypothetical protein
MQGSFDRLPLAFLLSKAFSYVVWMMIPGVFAFLICFFAWSHIKWCEETIAAAEARRREDSLLS